MRLATLILVGIAAYFVGRAAFAPAVTKNEVSIPSPVSAPASTEICDLDAEVPDVNFSDDHDPDAGTQEVDAWVDPDSWVTPEGVYPIE